jgi:hypothetical protein
MCGAARLVVNISCVARTRRTSRQAEDSHVHGA